MDDFQEMMNLLEKYMDKPTPIQKYEEFLDCVKVGILIGIASVLMNFLVR